MTRIVVGVDGSPGSRQALAWAVEEARRRHATVHAVTAWTFPPLAAMTPIPSPTLDEFCQMAHATLDEALADVAPHDVPMTQRVVQGKPAVVLAGEPAADDVLVVGRRGLGGFERLLLGSVSRGVLHRTHVPTVVVPSTTHVGNGIIVGIDGMTNDALLAAAVDAARLRQTGCTVLHAVETGLSGVGITGAEAVAVLLEAGNTIAAEAVAELSALHVETRGHSVVGSAAAVLVDAAEQAELLIVGRRSHGILGSVADACAAHAACPVLVVPER
jgi:nucleotide-binding universal stress UspA family protein